MKILEICPFSAGICGVWTRALSECQEFVKLGHNVTVFSSNLIKGTDETAKFNEEICKIKVMRFNSNQGIFDKFLSKNVTYFNFEKELKRLINDKQIDLVITHLLHPHSFNALNICLKNKIPCYLVTHAPFNVKRRFPLNLATNLYSTLIKQKIKKFTKIIAITQWEYPFLRKLGIKDDKITYIPNGIPEEFFTKKINLPTKGNDILFLGRIASVKSLETLLDAAKLLPQLSFSIVGSSEQDYLNKLDALIKKNKLTNVTIYPPIYGLNEKINLIDAHKVFVLPSNREAMPTVLLEAMARGKIVISSKTDGGKEIIQDRKNGFLFDIGDYVALCRIIKENILGNKIVQTNAIRDSKQYSWSKLIKHYISLFKK